MWFDKLTKGDQGLPEYLRGKGPSLIVRAVVEAALTIETGYHKLADLVIIAWGLALLERAGVITFEVGPAPLRRPSVAEETQDIRKTTRTGAVRRLEHDSDLRDTLEGLLVMDVDKIHLGAEDLKRIGEIAVDLVDAGGEVREEIDAEEAAKSDTEDRIVRSAMEGDEPPIVPHEERAVFVSG